jgi:hypothetical protein
MILKTKFTNSFHPTVKVDKLVASLLKTAGYSEDKYTTHLIAVGNVLTELGLVQGYQSTTAEKDGTRKVLFTFIADKTLKKLMDEVGDDWEQ